MESWAPRKFRAHFGVSWEVTQVLWRVIVSKGSPYFSFKYDHLLWALHFLKVYDSVDVSAQHWNVDPKTYHTWIWRILATLEELLLEVSFFLLFFY